jgi:hypothetical protein
MSIVDIEPGLAEAGAPSDTSGPPDPAAKSDVSQDGHGVPGTSSDKGTAVVDDPTPSTKPPTDQEPTRTDQVPPERDPGAVTGTRPTFTITDAATACGVSRKTITRKLTDLATHGAAKDDDGVWRIPVEALLALGLHPGRSLPSSANRSAAAGAPAGAAAVRGSEAAAAQQAPAATVRAQPAPTQPSADVVTVPRDRWDDLRLRLARAEAEAAERALALADARLALRALTAAPHAGGAAAAGGAPPHAQQPGPALAMPPAGAAAGSEPTPAPRKRRWWQSAG